jgi:two-component system sensor histidine kinase CiaH
MFRSATFKLTMWYLAIVMAISLAFSIVVYRIATDGLIMGLHHQTERLFNDFPVFHGDSYLRPGNDVAVGTHHILWQLIYFNFLVLVLAGVASYFLARHTLEPIQAAHERQKRFTADVSHELRTPLTALKMESEVALMDPGAPKADLRQALASNLEEANKMTLLINNLLKLTRLDDTQAQAEFKQIRSRDIVDAAYEQVATAANAKPVTIEKTGDDVNLQGDHDSLVQLLVILLDNAIKYSDPNGKITLSSDAIDNAVRFTIHDQGQGIPKADLPHVFDRFYRSDTSRTRAGSEGFGLGLSIAKLISDRHNGTITLTSRHGHGTTATVSLPAKLTTLSQDA